MAKTAKMEKYRAMSVVELTETIEDLKDELFNLNMQQATRTLERTSRIKEVKKDIARAKTILREHELGIHVLPGGAQ